MIYMLTDASTQQEDRQNTRYRLRLINQARGGNLLKTHCLFVLYLERDTVRAEIM
jgi:hypothetical protein